MIPWGRIALIVTGVMLVGVVAAGAWMGLVEAHLGLGQAACFLELHAEAETALKRLIVLNPRKAPAYSYLGAICFQQAGYVEAIPSLENAVLLDPNDADPWAMLGRCLVLVGRPADAIGPLEQALEARPGDTLSRQYLAQAYSALDRHDEMIPHLRAGLRTAPHDFDLTIMMGRELYYFGDRERAVTTLSHATQSSPATPKLASAYEVLGQASYDEGYYDATLRFFYTAALAQGSRVVPLASGYVRSC